MELNTKDLVESLPGVNTALKHWAILVRPMDVADCPPKITSEFDQSVVLDPGGFEYLGKVLSILKKAR